MNKWSFNFPKSLSDFGKGVGSLAAFATAIAKDNKILEENQADFIELLRSVAEEEVLSSNQRVALLRCWGMLAEPVMQSYLMETASVEQDIWLSKCFDPAMKWLICGTWEREEFEKLFGKAIPELAEKYPLLVQQIGGYMRAKNAEALKVSEAKKRYEEMYTKMSSL